MEIPRSQPAHFVTTQWTKVLAARGASPEAKTALADLCEAYYQPVFSFLLHSTRDQESARELTQEFFARLIGRGNIEALAPGRGRFRSYLLGAVKHFLADVREKERAAKRGRQFDHHPIQAATDTSPGLDPADLRHRSPEQEFDRQWALTTLNRALEQLSAEQTAAGNSAAFDLLKQWLTGDSPTLTQAEAAARLNLSEGAVKVAVHRLRRRFREAIKLEVARTLKHPAQVQEELQSLLAALG